MKSLGDTPTVRHRDMTSLRYAADGSYAYEEAWPLVEAGNGHGSFRVYLGWASLRMLFDPFFLTRKIPMNGEYYICVTISGANAFVVLGKKRAKPFTASIWVSLKMW